MRADLDRLFNAMGAYADNVPAAAPESARRRGAQRRRNRITIVCAAATLAVGAAAATTRADLGHRDTPPAEPTPRPTVAFTTLEPVGSAIPMALDTNGVGVAAVRGDRV